MIRLSITARLALLAIALTVASNLALALFLRNAIHNDAIGALRRETIEQADALVAVFDTGGAKALARAVDDAGAAGDQSRIAGIYDPAGRLRIGVGPRRLAPPILTSVAFRISLADNDELPWSAREAGFAIHRVGPDWLLTGRLLDDWQRAQRTVERTLILSMAISLVLGVLGGLVVTRYVGRRIDLIGEAARGVAAGDLSRRVSTVPGRSDAFDRLGREINAMLEKVERLMGELRVVTDSLAHDLRSPIARLRAKVEQALVLGDTGEREVALAGLLGETDLVMRMLSTVIEISRSESLSRDHFVRVSPAAVMEELAELYAPVAEEAGLRFALVIDDRPPPLALHRELMSQALANLLENAIRHGAAGKALTVRLTSEPGAVRFQVEDRGGGIPPADRAQALKRFGRLDTARTSPGAGLGLALVEAVARLHGGRLELGDNAPGLIACVIVPEG